MRNGGNFFGIRVKKILHHPCIISVSEVFDHGSHQFHDLLLGGLQRQGMTLVKAEAQWSRRLLCIYILVYGVS